MTDHDDEQELADIDMPEAPNRCAVCDSTVWWSFDEPVGWRHYSRELDDEHTAWVRA